MRLHELIKRFADLDVTIKCVDGDKIVFICNKSDLYICMSYDEEVTCMTDNDTLLLYLIPVLLQLERTQAEIDCGIDP